MPQYFNITDQQKDLTLESIYQNVYNNIKIIKQKYDNILNPLNNKTTKMYLNEGYSEEEAYALSFTLTLTLYLQVSGINIQYKDIWTNYF